MLFPTLTFGLFFLAVYAVAWEARRSNEWRKILLLLASWVFYGAWDWRFVALLILSAFLNWGAARAIADTPDMLDGDADWSARRRRQIMIAGVLGNVAILGFFKYYNFFLGSLGALLGEFGFARDMPLLEIVLPVGVSFFTFQGMSYLVDVYKREVPAAALLDITLLMSFFPHLVAGPIVRASDLLPQFVRVPRLDRGMVAMGLVLIVWGLFKKAVVASELSTGLVDPIFFDPQAHSSTDLVIGAYGYAVQIYCDFSAYSDMAIGLAALLGYKFPLNFNQPYRAASLQEFWRRWHISLSSWLRDYVYIAWLGGSRRGRVRTYANLLATMLIGGLWHGASVTFVIWGALHGAVLAMERLWADVRPAGWPRLPRVVGIILIFHVVVLGWIFFRSETFGGAIDYLRGIAAGDLASTAATPLALLLIAGGMAMHFTPPALAESMALRLRRVPAVALGLGIGVTILLIDALRYEGVAPFIYYQF